MTAKRCKLGRTSKLGRLLKQIVFFIFENRPCYFLNIMSDGKNTFPSSHYPGLDAPNYLG